MSERIKAIYTGPDGKHIIRGEGKSKRVLKHGDAVELSPQAFEAFRDRFKTQDELRAEADKINATLEAAKANAAKQIDGLNKLAGDTTKPAGKGKKAAKANAAA